MTPENENKIFEDGKFPNTAQSGRDPDLYPKKNKELISTGGWAEAPKTDTDELVEQVVAILKADGVFDNILVDEDAIVAKVVKALEDKGFGNADEETIKQNVIDALKADVDFKASLKGDPGESASADDVAAVLKVDEAFKESVKGKDGKSPTASEVAAELKTDTDVTTAVADTLKDDQDFKDELVDQTLDAIDNIFIQGVL